MAMRRLLSLMLAVALTTSVTVHAAEAQKREMRCAWIATVWMLDWPTNASDSEATKKADLLQYLQSLADQNFNAVFFQVRSMCDAMYASSYEPWSSYLTGTRGKNPGWDPLAYAVEQCHALGMQCHAWVNPLRFSTGSNWTTFQDVALKNSGLLMSYTNSSGTTTTILNPGYAAARQRVVDVCQEIINNYDVDGIVFDDYFYPNGISTDSQADDYELWQSSGTSMTFADWRRDNINQMVAEVYEMIQSTKPEVRFGISPAGVAGTSATSASIHNVTPCPKGSDWQYNGIFSDPLAWLEAGTIDYISPQLYWKTSHSTNPFGPLTQWWSYVANHFGRLYFASHSISGLSSSNTTSDWAEVAAQINYSRQYNEVNGPGAVLYSVKYINGDAASGLGDYLLENTFTTPAIIPAVTWKDTTSYSAPSDLKLNDGTLSWTAQEGTLVKYSVYAVPATVTSTTDAMSTTQGGIKADYLLGVTYDASYTLPSDRLSGYWYAVCVIDGYDNEGEPAYVGIDTGDQPSSGDTDDKAVTYSIKQVWRLTDDLPATSDARQGFGMNGKFYINDKAAQSVLVYDQNGATGMAYSGGANCGITRDEAGNVVVSNATFPNAWGDNATLLVIDPAIGEATSLTLPSELVDYGRSDFLGFARGNLLQDGEICLVGANSGTSISRIAITSGEVDTDNSYLASCDVVNATNTTVLNHYTDIDGNEAVLYVTRNTRPVKMLLNGDDFTGTALTLPNKGAANGAFPVVWSDMELVVYPTLENYLDGFAVAQVGCDTALVVVPATASSNANSYQANWLNAEVESDTTMLIYQYYPGAHMTLWRVTRHGGHSYNTGDVNHDGEMNITDVTALIDRVLNGTTMAGCCDICADINGDNDINITDVTLLIDMVLAGGQ